MSSYTWICLIINFLQTRDPPILPSLQARPHKKKVTPDGLACSFDDDLTSLAQYGRKNQQSVGELFFQFFRYHGHELDYEKNVISVREGSLISKEGKGWHLLMNNRLCVEEPFNTSRNLGNTADDTSFRGIHMELRRAFKHAAKGDLATCCEQFEFPPEEERTWERPPPQPRPILTPSHPSRGGRGGSRGGRYSNSYRGGFGGRRTSNTGNKSNSFRQSNFGAATSELSLQAQQQAQFLLHDQLYQQIQLLQAQEQELRLQLHNQALMTGRPPPVFLRQPFMQFPMPQQQQQEHSGDENARSRSGTVSHPLLSASQRQQLFYNPTYASVSAANSQGSTTNPPSPSTATALPDLRRNPRRSSVANGSPAGSLRAHSQPARPGKSSSLQTFTPFYTVPQPLDNSQVSKQLPASESSEAGEGSGEENVLPPNSLPSDGSRADSLDDNRQQNVLGYYITPQQLQAYQQNPMLPPLASQMGLALTNGYTPFVPFQQEYRPGMHSPEHFNPRSEQNSTTGLKQPSQQRSVSRPAAGDRGPLIVDGSVRPSEHRTPYAPGIIDPYTTVNHYTSTSDDHNMNTPASFSDSLSQDFQDPGPFEMEQSATFSSFETPKGNAVANEQSNGTNGQPEILASRLQNYHLSNAEKLAQSQPSPKAKPERPRNGSAHQGAAKEPAQPKHSAHHEKPASSANSQSATETRQQTSNSKRRPNGVDVSEKVNGVNHKPKSKGRHDASHNASSTPSDSKDRQSDHPPRKSGGSGAPNGVNDASHGGGWQTTKRKHRRNAKSSAETRNGINGGPEPMPADESLRKGG